MCTTLSHVCTQQSIQWADYELGHAYKKTVKDFIKMIGRAIFICGSIIVSLLVSASSVNSSTLSDSHSVLTPLLCDNSSYYAHHGGVISCSKSEPIVPFGYCATFNDETKVLSVSECPYLQSDDYNFISLGSNLYIILPRNLSQLNDYMCGPLNRKGLVCGQCADGFGPSITSFGYKCVNCTDAWYRVPLFLLLEFAPITVLYLIVLVFQISVTSPPMPCFIMYAQLVVAAMNLDYNKPLQHTLFNKQWDFRLDMKIIITLYGISNLDFFRYNILPPFCLSSRLDAIDMAAILGYVSAFYPIILIILTWLCVELHGRNFKLLVLMWRPFHKCFTRFRRKWTTKNDLIDVFITFFLLSYNKFLFQVLQFFNNHFATTINESGQEHHEYSLLGIDAKTVHCLLFHIMAVFTSVIFNVLPLLLLFFYPSRMLRSCLSKLHLNFIAVDTFTDKVYGCYRNGLEGGRDMRRFASLYFFLRVAVALLSYLSHFISREISHYYFVGTLLFVTTLLVALAKPYKKVYMTTLDVLFLFIFTVICYTLALESPGILLATRVLLAVPLVMLILYVTATLFYIQFQGHKASFPSKFSWQNCSTCFKKIRVQRRMEESTQSIAGDAPTPKQPLIQPTCTVINYSTIEGDSPYY